MDKKDIITVILDKKDGKQVISGYIFRGKEYLKEEKETDKKLLERITKEHPDFTVLLKEQSKNHTIMAISAKGFKQDDTITVIIDKVVKVDKDGKKVTEKVINGYIFRGKKYLRGEKETHKELCARIKKEHPDFMKLLKEQKDNNTLKKTSSKKIEKEENKAKNKEEKKYATKWWKRVVASLTVIATLLTGYIGYKHAKKYWGKNNTKTEMTDEMNLKQLISYLREGKQRESFELINNTQHNFNNSLAEKIVLPEDKDARIYLTSEEMIALFTMANSDTYTAETFYEIFDKSNLLNASEISDNYTQASRVLWAYYSRATEKSGMAELFQSDTNKQLVEQFEELVIKYNTSDNEGKKIVKNEINEFFANLTDESKLDNATKTNPEAVSYILTIGAPWAHANRIINETTKDRLVGINEVVTCDNLYNELKFIQEYALSQDKLTGDNTDKLNKLPNAMNKENQKSTNRDINITINAIEYQPIKPSINTNKNTNSNTTTTTTKQEEITKEEAVDKFGEEKVEEKEEEAQEQVKEENKQEEQNIADYQNGYNAGYENAYIYCATTGEKISTETAGTDKYKEGYQAGVNAGYKDGLVEYKAYVEAIAQATAQQTSAPVRTR